MVIHFRSVIRPTSRFAYITITYYRLVDETVVFVAILTHLTV